MLHPLEARRPVTDGQRADAAKVEYNPGDEVIVEFPDGECKDGKVVGPAFTWKNPSGKEVRLVPVEQDRMFWSGTVGMAVILVMDVFLKKKE